MKERLSVIHLGTLLGWFCAGIVIWNTNWFKNQKVFVAWINNETGFTWMISFVWFATICAAVLRQLPCISTPTIEFGQISIWECPFWVVTAWSVGRPVSGSVGWTWFSRCVWTTIISRTWTPVPAVGMTRTVIIASLVISPALIMALTIIASVSTLLMCSIARLLALLLMIQCVTIRVCWTLWWTSLSSDSLEFLLNYHYYHWILTVTKISDGRSFISFVIISKIQILDVIKEEWP